MKARGLYAKAQQSMADGDFQSAAFDLKQVLELNPQYLEARHALGECFLGMRMPQEAEAQFRKVLAAEPTKFLSWMGLGHALRLGGKLQEAREAYEKAAELKPESGEPHRYLAEIALAEGNVDGALEAYRTAADKSEGKKAAEYMRTLAEALMRSGRPAEAARAFASAIQKGLDGAEVWQALGEARIAAKDLHGALEALEEAARRSEDDHMAWLLVGSLRESTGDADGALDAFETARKIAPDNARVWEALGHFYLGQKRMDEAKEAAEQALAHLDGADPVLIEKVADLLAGVDDPLRAAELYKLVATDPEAGGGVALWWKLARAQARLPGREHEVRFSCSKIRELARGDAAGGGTARQEAPADENEGAAKAAATGAAAPKVAPAVRAALDWCQARSH